MRTHITLALSMVVSAALLSACDAGVDYAFDDPEVERVYERMMDVTAPGGGWERARYLEFEWAVDRGDAGTLSRVHRWDKWEGMARVDDTADGQPRVSIFDTDDPTSGRAWVGGQELSGEAAQSALESAYRAHINDAYWLVMPYKWADPGVTTRYVGEESDAEGRTWEVVELSFDTDIGLTPQNRYLAFVNPETGRMERWHHFSDASAEPSPADWVDWTQHGPIQLAENRMREGARFIFFPHLVASEQVPSGAFDPPTP
jgi:hypothetical protein